VEVTPVADDQPLAGQQQAPKKFVFPCQRWLGSSDSGGISGPAEVVLSLQAIDAELPHTHATDTQLTLKSSACALPHPRRSREIKAVNRRGFGFAGEDAYGMGGRVAVVADGVYEWKRHGIDAGEFSRFLVNFIVNDHCQHPHLSPLELMERGYEAVRKEGTLGSCTLVVCKLDSQQNILRSAVLGDSGFMIVRGLKGTGEPKIVFRSLQQEHQFGYPFQLGHHERSDFPKDAMILEHDVEQDDVIMMATDGLFDNLADQDIADALKQHVSNGKFFRYEATHYLAHAAFHRSQDTRTPTPYSMSATDEFNMVYNGGKSDDITVVLIEVMPLFAQ
jgi:protein phosphatase PTC7